ncbi:MULTISPECIES: DUF6083 domain-containing protein [unclassified Streptomyces]|uniref:DUF6083 domain-containing protein n=1 Tax=unclassified Streptomyces TaxID=2593676 RepID=UPI002E14297E|nr:DUF6083 domain-containing protein [Streptomyces sp. NBC_01197]WSR73075.1 DUF6083 domain-containing protein [Streptomyces sp. NBC_01197]WSS47216.1 DUF6083 domain-containing protein [Streptomyces sp. NBC_01180]WSS53346.1 DUF6083 domain-containing protein [Streptomyces sp. NBC_01180]
MHPTTASGHHWDGSSLRPHRPRVLRVAETSPTRLLRTAQPGTCRHCGNRIHWYPRTGHHLIALHPHELPTRTGPATSRWHVYAGTAHPHADGTPWCSIPHTDLCPAEDPPAQLTPQLTELRRGLALRTRRLLDHGFLSPPPEQPTPSPGAPCQPARPVVQLLQSRYLARHPIEDIRCVAQTRRRHRCPRPVLDPQGPAGVWTLMPAPVGHGQLALPETLMAVYDLTSLPYPEHLRWRTQRCPSHATAPGAADLALADWEIFDPLLHHQHMHPRLPTTSRRPRNGS